jgi:hypothetical protein
MLLRSEALNDGDGPTCTVGHRELSAPPGARCLGVPLYSASTEFNAVRWGQNRPLPKRTEVISMNIKSRFETMSLLFCLSLIALTFPLQVKAQNGGFDKFTKVTFNAPVEIPEVGAQVLPAGTYVIKLVGDHLTGNRHVVQIMSEDQTHVYATVLAIPNERLHPTGETVMMFGERAAGQPQAVRAWFYPGDNSGQEFVYPKSLAVELAKTNESVLSSPNETATVDSMSTEPVEETKVETAEAQPAPEPAPVAAPTPAPEQARVAEPTPAPTPAPAELPQTASSLPLVGLIGLLSLAGGIVLSLVSKERDA